MDTSGTFGRMRLIHVSEGLGVAEIGAACVVIWRKEVTRERFDLQASGLAAVAAKYGNKAAFLCVIEPPVPPPSEELRKASATMVDAHLLSCYAAVVEAKGFMAALTRSVLSGISLFTSAGKSPHSYFSNVSQAAAWMSRYIRIDARTFSDSVEVLRQQMDAVSARDGAVALAQ